MKRRCTAVAAIMAACLLSGCYSNVNREWFEARTQYSGHELAYGLEGKDGVRSLPPVLYSRGTEWYIAAYRCQLKDKSVPLHYAWDKYHERHQFLVQQRDVQRPRYHRITPELAAWLLHADEQSKRRFLPDALAEDFRRAGGEWLDTLPPGARAQSAAFLKFCKLSPVVVDTRHVASRWYDYPAAGLTFLCVDVPFSIVSSIAAGLLVSSGEAIDDDE
ncbi:MAG: hypothetical protein J1E42_02830 [Akkermansiaceae bacterium]|nr:hypothetical protein [Akkermansiaceae bacterium]